MQSIRAKLLALLPTHQGSSESAMYSGNDVCGLLVGRVKDVNNWESPAAWMDGKARILSTSEGSALDVNNHGLIVGNAIGYEGYRKAMKWAPPSFGGDTLPGQNSLHGRADAVNNAGLIVGYIWEKPHDTKACLWEDQQIHLLTAANGSLLRAIGINDARQIVGTGLFDGHEQGFVWEDEACTVLPSSSGSSFARSINNSGLVVGGYRMQEGSRPCVWRHGEFRDLTEMIPAAFKDMPLRSAFAMSVNNRGSVLVRANYRAAGSLRDCEVSFVIVDQQCVLVQPEVSLDDGCWGGGAMFAPTTLGSKVTDGSLIVGASKFIEARPAIWQLQRKGLLRWSPLKDGPRPDR